MLLENATAIFKKISHSAMRAGREPDEIKLIAVTKTVKLSIIEEAIEIGLRIFGENRVQEAQKKIESLSLKGKNINVQWHLIGHLQSNKARFAVKLFDLIHSVDSIDLAKEIDRQAQKINKVQRVLVQVKLSEEYTKHGIREDNLIELVETVSYMKNIKLEGLMTIPPFFEDVEKVRPYFRRLRQLRDNLVAVGFPLKELSMGMSGDFEVAIEEGSTMVRIGTAIFGQRS
ncbi:MAG: YggS family pyridoxal phosphate-dependent enzyme [Thermodesulfovibrionales bacterium]|nr:YggS family pyridoxal phosphate-dependent enzyme [Thermodesulfovibrionales bacterium]